MIRITAIESGELKIDDESKEVVWAPLSSAVEPPLIPLPSLSRPRSCGEKPCNPYVAKR
jgi:hypothetical protein